MLWLLLPLVLALLFVWSVWRVFIASRHQPMTRKNYARFVAFFVMGFAAIAAGQLSTPALNPPDVASSTEAFFTFLLERPETATKQSLLWMSALFFIGAVASLLCSIGLIADKSGAVSAALFGLLCTLYAHLLLAISVLMLIPIGSRHDVVAYYVNALQDPADLAANIVSILFLTIVFTGSITFPIGIVGGLLVHWRVRYRDYCLRRTPGRAAD